MSEARFRGGVPEPMVPDQPIDIPFFESAFNRPSLGMLPHTAFFLSSLEEYAARVAAASESFGRSNESKGSCLFRRTFQRRRTERQEVPCIRCSAAEAVSSDFSAAKEGSGTSLPVAAFSPHRITPRGNQYARLPQASPSLSCTLTTPSTLSLSLPRFCTPTATLSVSLRCSSSLSRGCATSCTGPNARPPQGRVLVKDSSTPGPSQPRRDTRREVTT